MKVKGNVMTCVPSFQHVNHSRPCNTNTFPLSRHFYKLQLYVMCMGVLPMCVPVCHRCARCPGSSEEGLRSQVTVSSRVGAGT